jgi:predicted DNA-binding transcriptional regulator AlpA
MNQPFFDVPTIASRIGVSVSTIRRDTAKLGIVPLRIGDRRAFSEEEVEALIHFREQVRAARQFISKPQQYAILDNLIESVEVSCSE